MRPRRSSLPPSPPSSPSSDAAIDALYGLEPVFEPSASAGGGGEGWATVECPWCWERYDTPVDLSAGSTSYVEDCQVCCRPIELALAVDDDGALADVRATRLD
jgi:hypothetical protein